ncbi:MAG TPA: outer membrane protein assembly factor BamD [Gemmatimonadota bacterium]|nr:outer membrane protein assembly factor BamD [Gemmatimonadota bacterium]
MRAPPGWIYGFAVLSALACASTVENRVLPADEQFAAAIEAYESGEYQKAVTALQAFAFNYPQDPRNVDARWLTAEAYYGAEDWATAAQEYLNFQRDYPAEARAPEALYQAGRAYQYMSLRPELDQRDTERAINVLERIPVEYPQSDFVDEARERRAALRNKLAEKVYLNAEFYFDNDEYRAAEIYLVDLIEGHADSSWLPAGYALLAETFCQQGLAVRAAEVFSRLRESFPDSQATAEADDRLPEDCRQLLPETGPVPAARSDAAADGR